MWKVYAILGGGKWGQFGVEIMRGACCPQTLSLLQQLCAASYSFRKRNSTRHCSGRCCSATGVQEMVCSYSVSIQCNSVSVQFCISFHLDASCPCWPSFHFRDSLQFLLLHLTLPFTPPYPWSSTLLFIKNHLIFSNIIQYWPQWKISYIPCKPKKWFSSYLRWCLWPRARPAALAAASENNSNQIYINTDKSTISKTYMN